ncbi:d-galactonate transporter [Novosphingobium nitrogenifigens DSM 19370]|uniref:D-galactonate transporter n=1 Tax=Novosphingobium nitrogenifigens DSM 19370 TaxID=983920 RepID=F1ZCZ5_9SPHN|nr:d-galactonate transporter [Novosphingobium nitrogenifigens DSM 19370]
MEDSKRVDGGAVLARAGWRIIPLLGLAYLVAFMDRSNISFAARTMNADLGFSATVYGIGGGVFFLSYALFEVPSNILLERVGARLWIARIMITWGVIAAAMMFVRNATTFYVLRFLLGLAEAGFFPGVIFYLSLWFPRAARGRAISRFYISGPLTRVVMGVVSVWLLALDGVAGLKGWQWLFCVEGLPAVLVGLLVLWLLPDGPDRVDWLNEEEKAWLAGELARDAAEAGPRGHHHPLVALRRPAVLLLGMVGFLTGGAYFTFTLSEPQILALTTGWSTPSVGYLVSAGGLAGAAGMLLTGWASDRVGTRMPFLAISALIVLAGYMSFALFSGKTAGLIGYGCYVLAWGSVTLSMWMLCTDLVVPGEMAVATAMVNTMAQTGAFVGPILWGMARDATGSFRAGFWGLVAAQVAALVFVAVLARRHGAGRRAVS